MITTGDREESFYCESALNSNSDFAEQVEFLDKRECYDPETASSSGASHIPRQSLNIPSKQIAYMIYERFHATRAYEAVQGLSDLFTTSLQNDDVQDFDVRWDQALYQRAKCLQM